MATRLTEVEWQKKLSKLVVLTSADKQTIETLQKKIEQQRLEISERSDGILSVQRNFEDLSAMCKAERKELSAARKELEEAKRKLTEQQELRTQLEAAQLQLKQQSAKSETLTKSMEDLEQKLTFETRKREGTESTLRELQRDASLATRDLKKASELQAESAAEILDLTRRCDGLTLQLQKCTVELEQTKAQLSEARFQLEAVNDKQGGIEAASKLSAQQYQQMSEQLKKALKDRDEYAKKSSQTQQDLDKATAQVTTLQQQSQALLNGRQVLQDALEKEKQRFDDMISQHQKHLAGVKGEMDQTRSVASTESRQWQQTASDLRKQLTDVQQQLLQAQTDLTDAQTETQSLKTMTTEQHGRLRILKKECAALKADADRASDVGSELVRTRSTIAQLQQELRDSQAAQQVLRDQLDDLQRKFAEERRAWSLDERLQKLRKKEREFESAVQKLLAAEEASESLICCAKCLKPLHEATTCVPCGHTFCENCTGEMKSSSPGSCIECMDGVSMTFHNETMENLSSKYVYRKQALKTLVETSKQLTVL
eukprot:TRINITY_DN3088_c0_g1_i1.p2 TRINITY_DN3088_c0_g1~~TRINITY_DN3088_c0_g1_i1.p2  ORF type:complete len:551 (+),score=159.68 TRINITY_DN3088_c0_g1_i1:27-1655(+)